MTQSYRGSLSLLLTWLLLPTCGLGALAPGEAPGSSGPPYFGFSVAGAGDVNGDGYDDVIVGAWGDDTVYAYHGSATGLSAVADWSAGGQPDSHFGWSIAGAGDVDGDGYDDVIVGARRHATDAGRVGRVVLFHGSADGLTLSPVWSQESDQPDSNYGGSVSAAGDVNGDGYDDVIVGAPSYDGMQNNEGRVFVYHGSELGFLSGPAWDYEGAAQDRLLGRAVAGAGDVNNDTYDDVIVGAAGEVRVFRGSSSGLGSTGTVRSESEPGYGAAVSSAGDVNSDGYDDVIVGAGDASTAFVYHGPFLGPGADWTAGEDGFFGDSVAGAGDLDGDGYDDVLVGAPYHPFGDSGRVFAYGGSAGGLATTAVWTIVNTEQWLKFGVAVAAAGDVNHDTFDDLIVGTDPSTAGGGFSTQERADLYYGSLQGLGTQADWSMYGFPPQPAGSVEDTLRIRKPGSGTNIILTWGSHQCGSGGEFEVYEGRLGSFSSHVPRTCNSFSFPGDDYVLSPAPESSYYLVVVHDGPREGSYGTDGDGDERPRSQAACRPQEIAACP